VACRTVCELHGAYVGSAMVVESGNDVASEQGYVAFLNPDVGL
jgi:hypothetical protein